MAQLKDLIVNGASRLIGDVQTSDIQISVVNAPTSASSSVYGPGSNGQILTSNGSSVYWTSMAASNLLGSSAVGNTATPVFWTGSAVAAVSANAVLTNLSSNSSTSIYAASPRPGVTGTLAIANGGTGATTAGGARTNFGLGNAKIFYGTCNTATATAAKAVTCADFTTADLVQGAVVIVNMVNTNSAAAADLTMAVNGTTAKSIKYQYNNGASAIPGVSYLLGKQNYIFCYDGTNWIATNIHYNTNSTYSAMSAAEMQAGTATAQRSMRADYIKSALAGLGGSGLTFTHNSTSGIVLNHTNSVTAKTSYASANTTANAAGGTIVLTDIKYDTEGHISSSTDRTITLGLVQGYGDTTNPYASKSKNLVLASPAESSGAPSFRSLVAADIPTLDFDKISGTLPINRGGTGKTLATSAWAALGGGSVGKLNLSTSANYYLAGNGTWSVPPGTYVLPAASSTAIGGVKVTTSSNGLVLDDGDISVDWTGAPVQSVNSMTGDVVLESLTIGTKHYNGTTATVIGVTDLGLASPMTFRGVTDTTLTNGTNVSPINIVSGGTIGSYTPIAGDVVLQLSEQMEYVYSGTEWTQLGIASSYSLAEHSHGYITNDGTIDATATIALNDRIVIADASDSGRVNRSNLTFDTTSTNMGLSKAGSWVGYLKTSGGTMTGAVKTNGLIGTVNMDYGDVLPATATEGQLFFQVSYGDNEFSLPAGGTAGYALVKNSAADGDVKWALITASDRVLKAGDTMSGDLIVQKSSTNTASVTVKNGSYAARLYLAANGNRGIYDNTGSKWIITLRASDNVVTTGFPLYGAVWNDYAEFRQSGVVEAGRVIKENGDDTLSLTTERLERGCEIVSDTFGFAIGQTEKAKTPTAASGRVLAYPHESLEDFKSHIGWPVCSGPEGTVSIMTAEEEEKYPSRIIGTISAVPDYAIWFGGADGETPIMVNGRVWIRIR